MLSRILEMCIYLKLEPTFDSFTGESQQGGMKSGDTLEHLAMMMALIDHMEKMNDESS